MAISAEAVKDLRERTGAGFMDCKRALEESSGDVEKAVATLREAGLAAAAKKAGRDAREGLVSSYIHTGGRVGVLLEVNCETDFVARNEQFQKLVKDIGMQIAGLNPLYVSQEQIPPALLAEKRAALEADEALAKKPEAVRAQIVDGQMRKWFEEVCLLEQPFRDGDETAALHVSTSQARLPSSRYNRQKKKVKTMIVVRTTECRYIAVFYCVFASGQAPQSQRAKTPHTQGTEATTLKRLAAPLLPHAHAARFTLSTPPSHIGSARPALQAALALLGRGNRRIAGHLRVLLGQHHLDVARRRRVG